MSACAVGWGMISKQVLGSNDMVLNTFPDHLMWEMLLREYKMELCGAGWQRRGSQDGSWRLLVSIS